MTIHILNIWQELVGQAKRNLEGDCPDVADTVMVEMDKKFKELRLKLACCYRQIDISYSRGLSADEILAQAKKDVLNEKN